ncbi:radical SAM protein [bacterium]|nr:radical SAM protein [bacterium]
MKVHYYARREAGLPVEPPFTEGGVECEYCINHCSIGEGEIGYCGFRTNRGGMMEDPVGGYLDWYYNSLPFSCVAHWVCPGCSGSGYPEFSGSKGPEIGYKNLGVFYHTCTFNCLFCLNHYYKASFGQQVTPQQVVDKIDERTNCICFYGGDPASQITHALRTARLARAKNRHLRICWETNGSSSPGYIKRMLELSLESGGILKIDLKAWNENLNLAICGVSNRNTLVNLEYASSLMNRREDPPLIMVSTPLVPGYIDSKEIRGITRFIARLNPEIPYSLLAYHPAHVLVDLPATCKEHARQAREIALEEGLKHVVIENRAILKAERY